MGNEKSIKIDDEFNVNPATVELLRRRIESDIKGSFFRWIGFPVGGAGVLAILLTIFGWIPGTISKVVEENRRVQDILISSTIEYMKHPEKGQIFISTQVEKFMKHYLQDPEGGQKLMREQIEASSQKQVELITNSFLAENGPELVRPLVDEYLKTTEVRELMKDTINEVLKPKLAMFSEEIAHNASKLIFKTKSVSMFLQGDRQGRVIEGSLSPERIAKGSISELYRFLDSKEAEDLVGKEVVLSMNIQGGPRYAKFAIGIWLKSLTEKFDENFRNIIILDKNNRFVAIFPKQIFLDNIDGLMHILNSDPSLRTAEAKLRLEQMFKKGPTMFIRSDWDVIKALRMPVWSDWLGDDLEVPVLGELNEFRGITSREKLIYGLLS